MKKILLLTTGGTIASIPGEEGLLPGITGSEMVELIPQLKNLCQLETKAILNLDSSNMQPEEWQVIARETYEGLKNFDGVVITHGTDTMGYTSSMLSFMLANLNKPVVITGSQLPIKDPDTDAKRNIHNSFAVACHNLPGVFIVFDGKIIRGTRAVKTRSLNFNAFESINTPVTGYVDIGTSNEGKVLIKNSPAYNNEFYNHNDPPILYDQYNPNVFLLKLMPGTAPDIFNMLPTLGYKGLVIECFGAGGLPFHKRDLLAGVKKIIAQNIPVIVTTQCLYDGTHLDIYEVGLKSKKAGVIQGHDMTTETIVTKLMWLLGYSNNTKDVEEMMHTNYCGEISI